MFGCSSCCWGLAGSNAEAVRDMLAAEDRARVGSILELTMLSLLTRYEKFELLVFSISADAI